MTEIRKSIHHLADGREVIYFDDADTVLPAERKPDERDLPPRPETARMRLDVLTGDWISVAGARQNRAFLPPAELDPLAPQTPSNPSEVPSRYDVAVFENKSPSFGPALAEHADEYSDAQLRTPALGTELRSVGRCEVVCFSPDHEGSFATLSESRARTVVEAWCDRTAALSALPGVQQVFPFENRGQAIGVTLGHPHGQIYSYPYITPKTEALIRQIDRYDGDLFADILAFEKRSERVVLQGEHVTFFVPFAARWPIEVHMLPHRQVADFAALTVEERDEIARLYRQVLRGLDAIYDEPLPYIAAWHQAPVRTHRDSIRLNLQITSPQRQADKLKYLAGSEAAMGAWIADRAPEESAELVRAGIARAN